MFLSEEAMGALMEVVSRHADDEDYYLQENGPERDYLGDDLAEAAEIREHIWRNCAEALTRLGACSGEIDECIRLADRWAELGKKAVAA